MNSLIYWFTIGIVAGAPIALVACYVQNYFLKRRITRMKQELQELGGRIEPPMP